MAGTTVATKQTGMQDSDVLNTRLQYNKLVDDVEVVRAGLAALAASFNLVLTKLDADAGVTDVNYNSTRAVVATTYDAASDLLAAKVANQNASTTT